MPEREFNAGRGLNLIDNLSLEQLIEDDLKPAVLMQDDVHQVWLGNALRSPPRHKEHVWLGRLGGRREQRLRPAVWAAH